jgi:hypothetical protein
LSALARPALARALLCPFLARPSPGAAEYTSTRSEPQCTTPICTTTARVACGQPSVDAPAGQNNVEIIAFTAGARAWRNHEDDSTELLTSVYYQAAGGRPINVRTPVADQRGLLLASEGLYFRDDAALYFWSPARAGAPSVVYQHNGLALDPVLDNHYVYFGSTAPSTGGTSPLPYVLQAFPRDGSAPVHLYDRANQVLSLTLDDTNLYWTEMTEPRGELSIWSAPKAGGGTPRLLYQVPSDPQVTFLGGIFVSGGRLYFIDGTTQDCCPITVYALPTTGGTPSVVWSGNVPPGFAYEFDATTTRLYQAAMNRSVVSVPLDNAAPQTLANCVGLCTTFTVQGATVMWGDSRGINPVTF